MPPLVVRAAVHEKSLVTRQGRGAVGKVTTWSRLPSNRSTSISTFTAFSAVAVVRAG